MDIQNANRPCVMGVTHTVAAGHYMSAQAGLQMLEAGGNAIDAGVAGGIVQKFVMYRLPVAILGDISAHLAASSSLRAFVYEANRGKDFWFVADESELDSRILEFVTAGQRSQ